MSFCRMLQMKLSMLFSHLGLLRNSKSAFSDGKPTYFPVDRFKGATDKMLDDLHYLRVELLRMTSSMNGVN